MLNIASLQDNVEFSNSKKDVLKYLKIIGVDSRFISYSPEKIYINNLRFSKFSKKRQELFNKQYGEIEVVRNSLFQKICAKASKTLSGQIKPKSVILIPENNFMAEIILEPYTRKYGVSLVYDGEYDLIANPIILDDKINDIFSSIFRGEGLKFKKNANEIYPLINVSKNWIDSFLKMDGQEKLKDNSGDKLANSFMGFLEDVAPQYKENVLKAYEYIGNKNLEVEK